MKLFSEHTEWINGGVNHWYLLDDVRTTVYGYRKFGQGEVTLLRTPIPFSDKGRKLKLEHDFGDVSGKFVHVRGSKGDVYKVDLSGARSKCSCQSFKYRGDCKHITLAQGAQ